MTKSRTNPETASSFTTDKRQEKKSRQNANYYRPFEPEFEIEAIKEEDMIEKLHSEYQTIKAMFHEKPISS
ncbi:MAG: hypothetical protein ABSG15_01100 [FCB group bacterium]|jgi:hypothetical protein